MDNPVLTVQMRCFNLIFILQISTTFLEFSQKFVFPFVGFFLEMFIFCLAFAFRQISLSKSLQTGRDSLINPLVPSGFFKPFFHFFSLKERVPLNQFFWRDHLNDRWAFFYQLMLISRSLSKGLIFRTQKSEGRFDPKKIFFRLLNAETTLKCFSRRKKNFFWKNFFEIFDYFESKHQSGAATSCAHYTPKSCAWHFYL